MRRNSDFRRFTDTGYTHTVLETAGGRAATEVRGARWVNVALSNLKQSIDGAYYALKHRKYERRYLGETAYRFNRRFHLRELVPRLLCAPKFRSSRT